MPDFDLLVERFQEDHPAMHDSLQGFARAALGVAGSSPRAHKVSHLGNTYSGNTHFAAADPRVSDTYQREDIVEYGAVLVAGMVLHRMQDLRLTRVTRRGSKIDYFVGTTLGDQSALLEVSGTDEGGISDRVRTKREQLMESMYRRPPFSLHGWVAVTHFAQPLTSVVEQVPSEE